MNEIGKDITIAKKQYCMVFTTQAMLEVTRKYGGIANVSDKLSEQGEEAIADLAWLIALLVNQGIEINNDETGENAPFITEHKVMLHLTPGKLVDAKDILMDAIADGMKHTANVVNNEEDEVLSELKNGEAPTGE